MMFVLRAVGMHVLVSFTGAFENAHICVRLNELRRSSCEIVVCEVFALFAALCKLDANCVSGR